MGHVWGRWLLWVFTLPILLFATSSQGEAVTQNPGDLLVDLPVMGGGQGRSGDGGADAGVRQLYDRPTPEHRDRSAGVEGLNRPP